MKYKIEFDTETKVATFFIDDKPAEWDNYAICKHLSKSMGVIVTYDKTGLEGFESHEVSFDKEMNDVVRTTITKKSLAVTPEDLIKKSKNNVDKIFEPKKIKQTNIKEMLPKPSEIVPPAKDLTDYSVNFKPR